MPETLKSKRISIVVRELYTIDLEYSQEYAILHLPYVKKFTKGVYLDINQSVEEVWDLVSTIGYREMFVAIPQEDKVVAKLVVKLGFILLGSSQGLDVYQYKEYL